MSRDVYEQIPVPITWWDRIQVASLGARDRLSFLLLPVKHIKTIDIELCRPFTACARIGRVSQCSRAVAMARPTCRNNHDSNYEWRVLGQRF